MKLLVGKAYDPATSVSKATTALLAMTALDTTNLRLNFTVPSHGTVLVRLRGVLHGATTVPQICLGVLEGSTVKGRASPLFGGGNIAATTKVACWSEFVVTGLTPSASLNWDAAYAVETVVASTGLKYGGPNDTTANNAFGAFCFEIYDPAPAAGSGSGATAQEVWEYATRSLTDKAGFSLSAAGIQAIWDALTSALTTVGSIGKRIVDNLDAAISSRMATFTYTAPDNAGIASAATDAATVVARLTSARATNLDNLDAAVSSRMATFTYTAPDNAGIAAVKAQTDKLTFTATNYVKVDACYVNGVQIIGAGTAADKWRAFGT